jgi:hypothetical protein
MHIGAGASVHQDRDHDGVVDPDEPPIHGG